MSRPSLSMMMPRVQTVSSVYMLISSRRSHETAAAFRLLRLRTGPAVRSAAHRTDDGVEIASGHSERRRAPAVLIVGDGEERRLLAQAFEIGAGQIVGPASELREIDIRRQRQLATAQANDRRPFG